MSSKRTLATYVLSVSIMSLAAALFYFTLEVARLVNQIPMVVQGVETVSAKIEPIVGQVKKVNDLVEPILDEVAEVRKQIPNILAEIKSTRAMISPVLKEVKATREMVPSILKEVKETRELIPSILGEVRKTREALPSLLVEADKVVSKAGSVGQSTSEGAVTGVFTGIFKAPFKLVGGLGSAIFDFVGLGNEALTDMDREIVNDKLNVVLTQGESGKMEAWSNPESGRRGSLQLLSIKSSDEKKCREISMKTWLSDKLESHSRVSACLNENLAWEVTKRVNEHND